MPKSAKNGKNTQKMQKKHKIICIYQKKVLPLHRNSKTTNNQPRRQRVTSGKEVMTTTTENKTMKKINDNVIIATSREMNEAGLFKCTPDDRITLWHYEWNMVWKKMEWAPIIGLHAEPIKEDIVNERGEVVEWKSTHKIDVFYGAPVGDRLDMRNFLKKIGVSVEPIEL